MYNQGFCYLRDIVQVVPPDQDFFSQISAELTPFVGIRGSEKLEYCLFNKN